MFLEYFLFLQRGESKVSVALFKSYKIIHLKGHSNILKHTEAYEKLDQIDLNTSADNTPYFHVNYACFRLG